MTKTCVVCKKEANPCDSSCSFHLFPNDKSLKEKWMKALQIQKASVHSAVCSDHFLFNDFHQTDGYTTRRRLLSQAIPQRFIQKGLDSSASAEPSSTNSTCAQEHFQGQRTSNVECSESWTEVYSSDSSLENITLHENTHEPTNLEERPCDPKTLKRRSIMRVNDEAVSRKKIRFKDGTATRVISRADFVSDEAWKRFLWFTSIKNAKIKKIRRQTHRTEVKIKTVKERIACLKKEKASSAAEYLELCV